jgi:hypothetical protein
MNPRWPVYIPSKGRSDTRQTARMFDALGVPYTMFVEPQEHETYARVIDPCKLHVLPHRDRGLTVTRNYIWDFAAAQGAEWFWTFDDNIRAIHRFNRNLIIRCVDGTPLAVIEDFAQRYSNTAILGMHYEYFLKRKFVLPPYYLNSRVYSNMLIRTDARDRSGQPFRNVTFYNDDTDLCLRVLKSGWCTVLFNAFLIGKAGTMTLRGGMTEYYAQTDKRREFAEELVRAHPDVARVSEKWGRWHHHVDYSGFRHQLQRAAGVVVPAGVNNFGMVLQERDSSDGPWRTVDRPGAPAVDAVDDTRAAAVAAPAAIDTIETIDALDTIAPVETIEDDTPREAPAAAWQGQGLLFDWEVAS